ncbi:MAG: methyltransferase domain-containing protein [Chloroherpetonaceae bacterium]|nr:methyltransferase domain-containing protein [Chthonomonadaceae bacterium]MDW8208575.1 methyltransferase domain-containing protein [Chloroherpetonaceae bacterium]
MHRETLCWLRCPEGCTDPLAIETVTTQGDRVEQGRLQCRVCGRAYTIEEGIARMLPSTLTEPDRNDQDAARKRREMAARDAQVTAYDRLRALRWFGLVEVPATLALLRPRRADPVLEAGCGTGRMTRTFATRSCRVVSVDYSLESLRACRRKLIAQGITNVDLIQADVCALPLQSALFPKVVSCQVLEHVPTPEARARMVAELARVARPGGDVVISAYQHSVFTQLWDRKEGEHAGGIYYYRFSRPELEQLLSHSLKVRRMTGALVYHYLAHCQKGA